MKKQEINKINDIMPRKRTSEIEHQYNLFIAERIDAVRKTRKLTYEAVTKLLNENERITLTPNAVSLYFRGENPLKVCMLYRICKVLNYSMADIVDEDISIEDMINIINATSFKIPPQ